MLDANWDEGSGSHPAAESSFSDPIDSHMLFAIAKQSRQGFLSARRRIRLGHCLSIDAGLGLHCVLRSRSSS